MTYPMVKEYHKIEFEGDTYFWIVKEGKIVKINESLENFLEMFDGKTSEKKIIKNFSNLYSFEEKIVCESYESIQEIGLIEGHESQDGTKKDSNETERCLQNLAQNKEFKPHSILMILTQCCNMRCKYCFEEGSEYNYTGKMTKGIAQKALDYYFRHRTEKENLHVTFFGGEPLLNFEVLKFAVEYTEKEAEKREVKAFFGATTNGTVFNKEIKDFCIAHRVILKFSIDGIKKHHDKNRVFADGKGTFDIVFKNLQEYSKSFHGGSVRMTLAPGNTDYDANLNLFSGIPMYEMGMSLIQPTSSHNKKYYPDYEEYIKNFDRWFSEKLGEIPDASVGLKKYLNSMKDKIKNLNNGVYRPIRPAVCNAFSSRFVVSHNGEFYPCERFVGFPEFNFGNLSNGVNTKRYTEWQNDLAEKRIDKIEDCKDCWARYFCLGGCYADNHAMTNDPFEPDLEKCELVLFLAQCYLKLFIKLQKHNLMEDFLR